MDRRVNPDAVHDLKVYKMSNAGAAFPVPLKNDAAQSNTQEDSLHILLERAKETHQTVLSAFSGHEDCVAVRSIWNVGNKPVAERTERDRARHAPYSELVEQVRNLEGFDETERLRLLTQAKVLQDINHAFAYDDIQTIVNENELSILAYYEDVTSEPSYLYLFDPAQNVFLPTTLRLKEFSQRPELLAHYALKGPVNVAAFINSKAALFTRRRYEKVMQVMMADGYSVEQGEQTISPAAKTAQR